MKSFETREQYREPCGKFIVLSKIENVTFKYVWTFCGWVYIESREELLLILSRANRQQKTILRVVTILKAFLDIKCSLEQKPRKYRHIAPGKRAENKVLIDSRPKRENYKSSSNAEFLAEAVWHFSRLGSWIFQSCELFEIFHLLSVTKIINNRQYKTIFDYSFLFSLLFFW